MRLERAMPIAIFVLLLAALPCVAQDAPAVAEGDAVEGDAILLRFNYEEGESLTYETTVDGVGSVHVMGQAQAIEMAGSMLVTMLVEEIDEDGNYVMVTEVDIAEMNVTMSGSPVPPPNQDIKVRTTMSPRGEILAMEMIQEVDQPDARTPWNAEMAKLLTGGFDLNQMLLGQKIAAFPEEAVSPGDEWKGNAPEIELRGETAPLEISTKYDGNLELEGRDCARLDSETSMQAGALGELATALSMEGFTTTQSRSWFDYEAGRTLATMEKTQVSMQVSVPAAMTGEQQAAGVFLEMFVDSESKLLPSGEEE
ncbi:MAG: hypothetical protein ACQER1_08350 [Armatimonadota bacterium]